MPPSSESIFTAADNHIARRTLLQGMCGVTAAAMLGALPACAATSSSASTSTAAATVTGLRDVVAKSKRNFGVAVGSDWLVGERDYARAVAAEANMLVPEYELKWAYLRPDEKTFRWTGYDRMANFAKQNRQRIRGHTLVWHEAMPQWALQRLASKKPADATALMAGHINTVVTRTAGVIDDWDVVNEAVDHESPRADGLRETPWLKALGPDYIAQAFRLTYAANPKAKLVYNDFDYEFNDPRDVKRRTATLNLLRDLQKKNVPIHALGLQSHLATHRPLDAKALAAFLKEVNKMGLEVMITELDIRTDKMNASAGDKVKAAGDYVANYLDIVRGAVPVNTVVTWGIGSRHSWVTSQYGPAAVAPLPLDDQYKRTAIWDALYKNWANI